MRIDLLRHGACEGGSIFRGHIDVPLTELGWQQMSDGLNALNGCWDRIITSPLQRCDRFARSLGAQTGLPVTSVAGIREIGFGDWEGLPVNTAWTEQRALCEAWSQNPEAYSPPGGEPYTEFRSRVLRALDALATTYVGETLLLVTHGGVIKLLLTIANNWHPGDMISLQVGYGFTASMTYDHRSRTMTVSHPEQSAYVYRA
ncbi:histidine phosphatase family protein [uncultured Microbulbifer sp.]|uniref:histidine phosphatase family protein n=1 Tax=uncultured Microbulbifer sp. TaxID=348147 RepID=UPI0026213C19|nr:histidine phosphatase family protein [uncultured Microbulbifer sp.]